MGLADSLVDGPSLSRFADSLVDGRLLPEVVSVTLRRGLVNVVTFRELCICFVFLRCGLSYFVAQAGRQLSVLLLTPATYRDFVCVQ